MSDEVKAAADRLLDPFRNYTLDDDGVNRLRSDTEVLACWYIADHANDDENAFPLSAEILQASGWIEMTYGWMHSDVRVLLFKEIDESTGWRVAGLSGNARVETVGDLRRLLDALHIPAVVVVPKGGER